MPWIHMCFPWTFKYYLSKQKAEQYHQGLWIWCCTDQASSVSTEAFPSRPPFPFPFPLPLLSSPRQGCPTPWLPSQQDVCTNSFYAKQQKRRNDVISIQKWKKETRRVGEIISLDWRTKKLCCLCPDAWPCPAWCTWYKEGPKLSQEHFAAVQRPGGHFVLGSTNVSAKSLRTEFAANVNFLAFCFHFLSNR